MATFVPNITDVFPEPAMYRPDFSFLDTMLRRRQAMYNQGFAEISSKYSTLAKNLTNPYNSQVRNQFLTQAQKELVNLSAMDLSQQQNVQTASNVFTPLYADKNVMSDLALTSHWDAQERIAESLRLKDGGKEFSQANLDFVRMQRNDFAQDRPENAGEYLANKRSYSPYRDYSAKFQMAYEKFKPSSEDVEYEDGQYIRSRKDASVRAVEFKKYLESVLTPEEKRQIEIEGIVKYGSTGQNLLNVYSEKVGAETAIIDDQVKKYEKALSLAKTDEDREIIKENIAYFKEKKATIEDNFVKLSSMDEKTLKGVKDRVAADIYYNETVGNFAKAAERTDIKKTVQANSIWTTIYSAQQQWARQKDQQSFDWAKMLKEDELKKAGTTITGGALTGNNVVLKASESDPYGVKGLDTELLDAKNQIAAASQVIVSRLVATNQATDNATVKAFIDKYAKIQADVEPVVKNNQIIGYQYRSTKKPVEPAVLSDLSAFAKWSSAVGPAQMTLQNLEGVKGQLDSEVKKLAGDSYTALDKKVNAINNGKSLNINVNGKTINLTNKEIFDGMNSGAIRFESEGVDNTFTGPGMSVRNPGTEYMIFNGNKIQLNRTTTKLLSDAVQGIRSLYGSNEFKTIANVRNQVYTSNMITNNPLSLFDTGSAFYKDKQGEIDQIFGKPMQIRGTNLLDGSLAISASDKASTDEILARTKGRADVTYDKTNDLFYLKGLKGMNILSNFSPEQQSIYRSATTPVKGKKVGDGIFTLESSPFKIGNLPYDFQWTRIAREGQGVDGTKSITYEYFLFDGNNKSQPLDIGDMNNALQLVTQIGNLGNNPGKAVQIIENKK